MALIGGVVALVPNVATPAGIAFFLCLFVTYTEDSVVEARRAATALMTSGLAFVAAMYIPTEIWNVACLMSLLFLTGLLDEPSVSDFSAPLAALFIGLQWIGVYLSFQHAVVGPAFLAAGTIALLAVTREFVFWRRRRRELRQ